MRTLILALLLGLFSTTTALAAGGVAPAATNATATTGQDAPVGQFDTGQVFPAWDDGSKVQGVIGQNGGNLNEGAGKLIIYFIPKAIELLIWVVAPLVMIMFIFAGLQFIYGGDREEEVKKARDFFRFAIMGLVFITLSYSLMKAVYFILA